MGIVRSGCRVELAWDCVVYMALHAVLIMFELGFENNDEYVNGF